MPTISTARAETRTITIPAPPAAVLGVIADPLRITEWAPDFAVGVTAEGDHWRVDMGGGSEVLMDVVVHDAAGTVDVIRANGDVSGGVRLRAIPSGGGTELVFTILMPRSFAEEAVTRQMVVVEEELARVRALAVAEA